MDYHGPERRMNPMHTQPLAECVERYNHIVDKLDGLIQRLDKINGRYEKHLDEAIPYRGKVDEHTEKFTRMDTNGRWAMGIQISTVIAIVVQVVTFAFLWGSLTKQVEINTHRWEQLIETGTHKEVS